MSTDFEFSNGEASSSTTDFKCCHHVAPKSLARPEIGRRENFYPWTPFLPRKVPAPPPNPRSVPQTRIPVHLRMLKLSGERLLKCAFELRRFDLVQKFGCQLHLTLFRHQLSENATIPTRGSPLAAGYDLSSAEETVVPAGGRQLVKTDIAIAVPQGTYGRYQNFIFLLLRKGWG